MASPRDRTNDTPTPADESSSKTPVIEIEGEVVDSLPNTMFLVKPIGPNGQPLRIQTGDDAEEEPKAILAHLAGKMRLRFIRVGVGDRVRMQLSPYDLSRGRITWRLRADQRVER